MMTIEQDRDSVRDLLIESRRLIKEGDAEAANAETAKVTPIAERWETEGRLAELLAPLLEEDEKQFVRYNAASYLLSRGDSDTAVPVLESVAAGHGLAALGAERVLATWRKQNA